MVVQGPLAADPGDHVTSEGASCLPERLEDGGQVVDFDREAVPSSRCRHRAVGHGLATTWSTSWGAQDQSQISPGQHGEGRCRIHLFLEFEVLAVERYCGVDVVDDVADADSGH